MATTTKRKYFVPKPQYLLRITQIIDGDLARNSVELFKDKAIAQRLFDNFRDRERANFTQEWECEHDLDNAFVYGIERRWCENATYAYLDEITPSDLYYKDQWKK